MHEFLLRNSLSYYFFVGRLDNEKLTVFYYSLL
nr:MAG TPA: hypothetical protein [Caudoviricetes sp.]